MSPPNVALPDTVDELLHLIAHDPDLAVATAAAREAMIRTGLRARWPQHSQLALVEELTDEQRRLAEALLRVDVPVGGCGIPSSKRLLRRWLGVDPPGVLERRVAWTFEGNAVNWPLWRIWRDAPLETLEHNQGLPLALMEILNPAERIEAAAERTLEPYGIRGFALEARLCETLDVHGASAASWASGFADRLAKIRSPDGPRSRPEAGDYGMLGIYDWDTLAIITLFPLVRAGVALEPRWDIFAPFSGSRPMVREILSALPADRREVVVHRRLMTDWGEGGAMTALNGFDTGLSLLDLAPSTRVAEILSAKLKSNRSFFKKRIETIRARLDALAAEHPEVAAGLAPRRKAKKRAAG